MKTYEQHIEYIEEYIDKAMNEWLIAGSDREMVGYYQGIAMGYATALCDMNIINIAKLEELNKKAISITEFDD